MDKRYSNNDYFQRYSRYKEHLSLFGAKVLDNLVKKWISDQNRQDQNSYQSYQSRTRHPDLPASHWPRTKKVLTFLNEQTQMPHVAYSPSIVNNERPHERNDQFFDIDFMDKHLPSVLTANELFKTVEQTTNSPKYGIDVSTKYETKDRVGHASTYDIINTVLDETHAEDITNDFYNKKYDTEINSISPSEKAGNGFASITGSRVNWDDMFDTELFPVIANANSIKEPHAIVNTAENAFSNVLTEEANNKAYNKKDYKLTKTKETKSNNIKNTKRKTHPKATDIIPKKVTKIASTEKPKHNCRKQKYTKTVENWLGGMQLYNSIDEDNVKSDKEITEDLTKKTDQITTDKSQVISNKKVVQAQLANKDGKMKFGKPKDKIVKNESAIKKDNEKLNKTKDTKIKPKFVTPIKSQVPVKEVHYEVISVDNNNIQDNIGSLHTNEDKDAVIFLVYSNGLSQLNDHHTEDACEQEGFIISIDHKFFYFKGVHQSFKEVIEKVLQNNRVICYDGKHLLIYFKSNFGLECNNFNLIDAKIGGSILDPDNPPENFSDLQKLLSYTPQYTIATECVLQKTAWYATVLDECGVKLTTLLKENGLWSVFVDIEMKLMPIIAEMELRGVTVDIQKLKSMEDVLLTKMKEVEQQCYKAAGRSFQLNSAVQIRAIIYDELQLDTKCNVKIKETICKGAKSTSETMLRSLVSVHPLPKLILEYRHLHKAHATFLTGIAQQVKDGIVRPTWVQTAAATGRIASNNPNLQAIPKAPFSLVLFPDENTSGNQTLSIRSVYKSRDGYCLVAADFQHVECRVFAHCAGDTLLLHALQAGGDLFRALAAKWLNKPESDISSEDRERTKRIVYASLYGAGCRKIMDILGVSYEQTLSIIASFNRTFPSLKSFGRSVVSRCEQNGGRLSTLCGRGRRFKHITSQDFQLKSQAERQAVNFIVQGSAADLCKMAMVVTSDRLRSHTPPVDGCLLLQIHDELVWEIRHEHVHTAAAIIKEVMEGCGQVCGMALTLPVSVSTGRTWGDMAEYSPL